MAQSKINVGAVVEHEVQGLIYTDPPIPPLRSIRNWEENIEDQVWVRDTEYERWEWNTDPLLGRLWFTNPIPNYEKRQNTLNAAEKREYKKWEEQMTWYESAIERLHTGEWIMINGVPTYFNKYCLFFHQWFVLLIEQIFPSYKDTSLEYYRFYELCEKDRGTLGDCGIKGRRLGLSSMASSIHLQIGIIENNTLQGIVSKTGTDAYEMYLMIKNGLENLPPFFMPELNKVTESEIHIAKPQKKISSNNKMVTSDKGLNNRINYLDTAENAYDGRRARRIIIDEAGKFEKVNVQTLLNKISDTLVVGSSIGGHVSVFSTVNKGDKGGENFRKIWDGSNHIDGKKDRFGRTETCLKRFFIAGYRGLLGYIDKYGNSVVETPTPEQSAFMATVIDPSTGDLACLDPTIGAKAFLQEARNMKANDPEQYAEQVRKYPFEWKEVFKGANNRCNFDLDALNEQIQYIEDELVRMGGKQEFGRRMSFKNGHDGKKIPVDDPKGMWYIIELLDEGSNRSTYRGNIKCPENTIYGAAGLDTFANAKAAVDKGSDACLIVHKRYDALNPEKSGMPIAMFIGRPKTKEAFHDQVFWGLEYYGIKMLAERAPTDWEDYATSPTRRLASPLNHDHKFGYLMTTRLSDKRETYGVPPQNKEAREQHLTEMIEYSINNMKKIKFLRLLKDMRDFDINDRGDYDACMAWGYALMGLKEATGKQTTVNKVVTFMKIRKSKKYNV